MLRPRLYESRQLKPPIGFLDLLLSGTRSSGKLIQRKLRFHMQPGCILLLTIREGNKLDMYQTELAPAVCIATGHYSVSRWWAVYKEGGSWINILNPARLAKSFFNETGSAP